MDRYSISVTVVYLLMCWMLKVGREDELAHRYYRLLREGMRRGRGRGRMMTVPVIFLHRGGAFGVRATTFPMILSLERNNRCLPQLNEIDLHL